MKAATVREIAEIVGIASIVASLIFVGLQLRQSDKIATAELAAVYGELQLDLLTLLSDHSDVWARGSADAELSEADSKLFEMLVLAMNEREYSLFLQIGQIYDIDFALTNLQSFSAFLFKNPGVRRVWTEREAELVKTRELFGNGDGQLNYTKVILANLDQLDRMSSEANTRE